MTEIEFCTKSTVKKKGLQTEMKTCYKQDGITSQITNSNFYLPPTKNRSPIEIFTSKNIIYESCTQTSPITKAKVIQCQGKPRAYSSESVLHTDSFTLQIQHLIAINIYRVLAGRVNGQRTLRFQFKMEKVVEIGAVVRKLSI